MKNVPESTAKTDSTGWLPKKGMLSGHVCKFGILDSISSAVRQLSGNKYLLTILLQFVLMGPVEFA